MERGKGMELEMSVRTAYMFLSVDRLVMFGAISAVVIMAALAVFAAYAVYEGR